MSVRKVLYAYWLFVFSQPLSHAGQFKPEEWEVVNALECSSQEAIDIYFFHKNIPSFRRNQYKDRFLYNRSILSENLKTISQDQNLPANQKIHSHLSNLIKAYEDAFNDKDDLYFGARIWQNCLYHIEQIKAGFLTKQKQTHKVIIGDNGIKSWRASEEHSLLKKNIYQIFEIELNEFQAPFYIYIQQFYALKSIINSPSSYPVAICRLLELDKALRQRGKYILSVFDKIQILSPHSWKRKKQLLNNKIGQQYEAVKSFTLEEAITLSKYKKTEQELRGDATKPVEYSKWYNAYCNIVHLENTLFNFPKLKFRHKETKSIISFSKDDEKIFTDILAGISHAASPQAILQKSKTPTPKIPNVLPSPSKEEKKAQENDSLVSAPTSLSTVVMEENSINQSDSIVIPVTQEKEPEDTPVEALRAQLIDIQTALEEDTENCPLYNKAYSLLEQLEKNTSEPVLSQLQEATSNLYARYRQIKPKNNASIIVPKNHEDTFRMLMYTHLCYLKDNVRFGPIKSLIEGLGGKVHDDCAGSRIKIILGEETCGIHLHQKHTNLIDSGRIASLRTFFLDAGVKLKDE